MRNAHPALAAVVLVLSMFAACIPSATPPRVAPRSALSLDEGRPRGPGAASGPLRVIFAAPRGETASDPEIGLMFDRPMRALGLGPSDPPPPVTLRPAAKGAFHWIGSSTLRFDAETKLAPATAYTVEIPAGTRALDGSTLAEPFVLSFTTPRAAVAEIEPADGATGVEPGADIALRFRQRVSNAEIARAVTIRADKHNTPIPFTISRRDGDRVHLVPAHPLPLAARIHVRVDASLRGEEGDLPAGKARDIVFTTVMPPSVRSWRCEPHDDDPSLCDVDAGLVTIELSGEVPRGALARAVTIEPPVTFDRAPFLADDYPTSELAIYADWKPGATYRVRLAPGAALANAWGQKLAGDAGYTVRFGHRRSHVDLGLRGTYWRTTAKHAFEARATNASRPELHAVPRSLDEVLGALGGHAAARPTRAGFPLVERPLDDTASTAVRLDDLVAPSVRGPVDLVAAFTPRGLVDRHWQTHEVQLTDLGITARLGHFGAALLVTGLDDAKPAAGASVELYRVPLKGRPARLGGATVGALGDAAIRFDRALDEGDKLAVVARHGDDWTYRTIATPRPAPPIGTMFTERGIYRPGETVKITGVFRERRASGLAPPEHAAAHVVVRTNERHTILERDVALSAFGTFTTDVPIPREATLGRYQVEATLAGGRAWSGFFVAEYRPTEIEVFTTADRPEHTRGETLRCDVRGKYLHGGPMAGASASVVVRRGPTWFDIPGHEDFSVRDFEGPSNSSEILRRTAKLDAKGELSTSIPLSFPDQSGPESVRCAIEVVDLNRQALGGDASTLVHPGELYVALARRTPTLAPGGRWSATVLAVTPKGQRRAARVHVEAVLRDRPDDKRERPVGACDVTTGDATATCAITVPRDAPSGSRVIVRASVKDSHGNVARASQSLDVEIPPKPAPRPPPPPPRPSYSPRKYLRASVERELVVGQTAHVAIESGYTVESTALVTIEREGILWQRALRLPPAGARVEVPVTGAMIPEATVSVVAISGERAERDDASFEVDASPKRLTVDVDVGGGEAHRPGEAVDVHVRVKDADGHPARAEITLWSADEASLSLIGYRVPNVHERMFSYRPHLVTHADSRDDLVRVGVSGSHRTKPPQVRMGATQVSPPRTDFKQTAFFEAHLVTDDAGRLTKRVTLPDGLTTYRVMAVAVTADDRFGSKETKVVTSLPLMARASLPRVVRVGDRFEASVVVTADADGDAVVTAEASGVTILAPKPRTLHVAKAVPVEVRFPVRTDGAGPARFTFRATRGSLTDAMTLTRDVVPPIVPEAAAIDGQTDGAAAEALGDLSAIRPDYGGLDVSLSTSPLAGLADGIEQLVEYPYGCTEQTVSRLVPLLALRDLAESLGASLPDKTGASVRDAVERLLTHQRRDGGFGLWRSSSRSTPWLTAWAAWGLGAARRRGCRVPPSAESRARAYLAGALSVSSEAPPDKLALAAFVADLAAIDSKPDAALVAKVFALRDRLPPSSRGLLLHAMALARDARAGELIADLESQVRLDGGGARVVADRAIDFYDSDTRATAMLLRGLVAADPKHALVPKLARGLLDTRHGGRFRTTHDAAWALLALDELRRASPPAPDETFARVFLGDAVLRETTLRAGAPLHFDVPASRLVTGGTLPLTFAAGGPLHYHARLRFARRDPPKAPVESGMFLRRTMRSLDADHPLPSGALAAGTLVVVQLDLATPSPRHAVVIESPLPAGLEAADADLRLGGSWVRRAESHGRATKRELRDDRVVYFVDELPAGLSTFRFVARATTPGVFIAPPARAEEMYAPDTFARTAMETLTVRAP